MVSTGPDTAGAHELTNFEGAAAWRNMSQPSGTRSGGKATCSFQNFGSRLSGLRPRVQGLVASSGIMKGGSFRDPGSVSKATITIISWFCYCYESDDCSHYISISNH